MPTGIKKSGRVNSDEHVVFYGTVIRVGEDNDEFTRISVKLDNVQVSGRFGP